MRRSLVRGTITVVLGLLAVCGMPLFADDDDDRAPFGPATSSSRRPPSIGTKVVVLKARRQTAEFVTRTFTDQPSVPKDLVGTLSATSDVPVAMVGLRFRGESFSTIPVTHLSSPIPVPVVSAGVGGAAAVILPHFADGGGWGSEIVLANTSALALTVRVDLFGKDGTPLEATFDRQAASRFTGLVIPAGGALVLSREEEDDD